jgi:hypothetical protein
MTPEPAPSRPVTLGYLGSRMIALWLLWRTLDLIWIWLFGSLPGDGSAFRSAWDDGLAFLALWLVISWDRPARQSARLASFAANKRFAKDSTP